MVKGVTGNIDLKEAITDSTGQTPTESSPNQQKRIRKPSARLKVKVLNKFSQPSNFNSPNSKVEIKDKKEILRQYKLRGNRWKIISEEFDSISENTVKNIFFGVIRMALRKIGKFFGVNSQSVFISQIKPNVLTDIIKLGFKDHCNNKHYQVIEVIEKFAFTEFESLLEEINRVELKVAKRILAYVYRFAFKFYSLSNKEIEYFLKFSLKENIEESVQRFIVIRDRIKREREDSIKRKQERTILKKYHSYLKAFKKSENFKEKFREENFRENLVKFLSNLEEDKRNPDKNVFINNIKGFFDNYDEKVKRGFDFNQVSIKEEELGPLINYINKI